MSGRRPTLAVLVVWTRLLAAWLCLLAAWAPLQAQDANGCGPFLRFQIRVVPSLQHAPRELSAGMLRGTAGADALTVVEVVPFSLSSEAQNTVSLLIAVWNGGLRARDVTPFVESLRKEERLHLRLSVLTRAGVQSAWTDNREEQRRLLDTAAAEEAGARADEPGYMPRGSDEAVLQERWNRRLQAAVEDLIRQPGKQAVLELLPPNPLRPPLGGEHWRIPPDRDFIGESQVHTVAALGLVPVYRAHHSTPALSMIIPGGDASTPAPSMGTADPGLSSGLSQLAQLQNTTMRAALPPASNRFADLGGHDVYEARDAMPVLLGDVVQTYTVAVQTARGCSPHALLPLRLWIAGPKPAATPRLVAPAWLLVSLLGRPTAKD